VVGCIVAAYRVSADPPKEMLLGKRMTAKLKHRTIACFATLVTLCICLGCGNTTSSPEPNVTWVDPNEIHQGPTLHDDFKRDLDPEGNIKIWEDMEVAYNSYCTNRELPLETRKEVFKIVLMRSMMPDAEVLARLDLKHVPSNDVRAILAAYPSAAKPIDVIQTGP